MENSIKNLILNDEREKSFYRDTLNERIQNAEIFISNLDLDTIDKIPRYVLLDNLITMLIAKPSFSRLANEKLYMLLNKISNDPFNSNVTSIFEEWFSLANKDYISKEKQEDLKALATLDIEGKTNELNSGSLTMEHFSEIIDEIADKCKELRFKVYFYYKHCDNSPECTREQFEHLITEIAEPYGLYMKDYYLFYLSIKDSKFSEHLIKNYFN